MPWKCDVVLKFDNGATIEKGSIEGKYGEAEVVKSFIDFHTEYLDDDETCDG